MEQAIKKAIEGGWEATDLFGVKVLFNAFNEKDQDILIINRIHKYVLDPLFWQALGKAEGWDDEDIGTHEAYTDYGDDRPHYHYYWTWHWHRFIDHIAEGKDIDSFFNELLK